MRIVRFTHGLKTEYGIIYEDAVQGVSGNPFGEIKPVSAYYPLTEVRLLAPCLPSKVVALGVNYHSHGEEMNSNIPTEPLLFIKPSTAVIGPEAKIVYPPSSARVDYEGELGVVIKTETKNITEKEAPQHILGYTCVNDVTARDLQSKDKQWTRAKSFDTFCPIGPWIETEISPHDLEVETYLNGVIRQKARTSQLIFKVYETVSFISKVMTLLPGDVIATGTTSGIGPMQPGDTVEVKIEGIGILKNYVIKQEEA